MTKPLRVLIVEDNEDDALLLVKALKDGGYKPIFERVDTSEGMKSALSQKEWDCIISDYVMPHFSGLAALREVQEHGVDIPFILVSGTIGEDVAVEAMKAGAHDYIMKSNLARLIPALERELADVEARRKHKQAEQKLKESEKLFRQLTDTIKEVFWMTNPQKTEMVYVSHGYQEIWGRPCESLLSNPTSWIEAIHPDDRERTLANALNKQINGTYDEEYRIVRPDGSTRWIHDKAFPVKDEKGEVIRIAGVAEDITERKRAEAELRKNELHFQALYESSPDGIIVVNASGVIVSINRQTQSYFGYTKEELIGKSVESLIPDRFKDHQVFSRNYTSDAQIRPMGAGLQLFARRKDGTEFPVEVALSPIQASKELNVIATVRDVTEKKRAEEVLRNSEEQFRLISENVADMIAVLDREGKRLYNSPSYKPVLGDPESLRGTDSFQEIHPEDRERIRQVFQKTVKTGIGQRSEYRFLSKDGGIHDIESQGSVIRDDKGNIGRVIVVSRDVTEKKRLEKQFLRAQRMDGIGTLAGGIAHDLNNVLAPIMLSFDILGRKLPDEQSQKMLQMLQSTARRGSDLINQVLSFARGVEGERTIVQLRHLIEEIGKIISETFPKSISFSSNVPKNLPTISADATQIHQVLMNLCVNARDAMPKGGTLDVTAEIIKLDEQYVRMHVDAKPGLYVLISVTDQGTGIPPTIMDKIFDPFFTTKEVGKGTGLGLSTVLGIIKSHDGFVNVYSDARKGTTFRVYLPAQEGAQSAAVEEKENPPTGNGELILVVDDEASIREITKATLEAYEYSVITAADGTEAVSSYATHGNQIALVVTDMIMPYMDGAATIRALQKMNPKVKILAVSGLKQNGDGVKHALVAFLHKPYTSEKLLKAIGELLHRK